MKWRVNFSDLMFCPFVNFWHYQSQFHCNRKKWHVLNKFWLWLNHYCNKICEYNLLLKKTAMWGVLNELFYLFFEKAAFFWRYWEQSFRSYARFVTYENKKGR